MIWRVSLPKHPCFVWNETQYVSVSVSDAVRYIIEMDLRRGIVPNPRTMVHLKRNGHFIMFTEKSLCIQYLRGKLIIVSLRCCIMRMEKWKKEKLCIAKVQRMKSSLWSKTRNMSLWERKYHLCEFWLNAFCTAIDTKSIFEFKHICLSCRFHPLCPSSGVEHKCESPRLFPCINQLPPGTNSSRCLLKPPIFPHAADHSHIQIAGWKKGGFELLSLCLLNWPFP